MTVFSLVRGAPPVARAPQLDEAQQAVVAHRGGPLLVLAGPGTGKTATLVEAVRHLVVTGRVSLEQVLVLTFSRRAAHELRARVTARLGGTSREPTALTFHSYAFGVVRRASAGAGPPRVLTAAEQLIAIRALLRGQAEDGTGGWPASLRAALPTLGFAEEVRDLVQRAQERGLAPAEVARLGRRAGRPEWAAVGRFMREYQARFDLDLSAPVLDYTELVQRAADVVASDSEVGRSERAQRLAVFVDEYQDTDPAQQRLLRALAGDGRHLVVAGDPDQSVYGFRGATVGNLRDFPRHFATAAGPVPVVALDVCRRSGAGLLAVSRAIAGPLPLTAGGREHRALRPAVGLPPGVVRTVLADSAAGEAAAVADALRRAHVVDGIAWSDMAVLVRSASRQVPILRRALSAVGVPVAVAGDEVAVAREPAVRPLLLLLRAAFDPVGLSVERIEELLTSPLGRADAIGIRQLARAVVTLRSIPERSVTLADALAEPDLVRPVPYSVRAPLDRIRRLVDLARATEAAGGSTEGVLWAVWAASGLAERWRQTSLLGGPQSAAADRGLDAVSALFDLAARFTDRLVSTGPAAFVADLEAQEIPADVLADRGVVGEAVRVLTAHRSKGLQWRLVVVTGVQEGRWPDTRRRGSLLGPDELAAAADRVAAADADRRLAQLHEERRLFYVALTRASERLLVTAVGAGDDGDERPSRLFEEVVAAVGEPPAVAGERPPLSLPGIVAHLRSVVADERQPEPRRRAAGRQLARLALAGVPGAAPGEWWALTRLSDDTPVRAAGALIPVSPSRLELFGRCPRRWFLEEMVGVRGDAGVAQTRGTLVHALATLVAGVPGADATALERVLADRLDAVWPSLDLGPPWQEPHLRAKLGAQLRRFAQWHAEAGRDLVAVEVPFEVRSGRAVVSGRVDRLELDHQGRGVVTDLKTGTAAIPTGEVATHPQLGLYQLAVAEGGFAHLGVTVAGGAAAVQVGGSGKAARCQEQVALDEAADPRWVHDLLAWATEGMSQASFDAVPNPRCRTCPVMTSCPARPEGGQVVG